MAFDRLQRDREEMRGMRVTQYNDAKTRLGLCLW